MSNGGIKKASKSTSRSRSGKACSTAANTQPVVTVDAAKAAEHRKNRAIVSLSPTLNAACIVSRFAGDSDTKLIDLIVELDEQGGAVLDGHTGRVEMTLISQAHSLDVLFNKLAQRSASNMEDGYLDATETYMKLALRAQSQCRATLETLSVIKNPPVVFAKQANIAHGHQQVNYESPRAENEIKQPKLLEHEHDKRLDATTPRQAGGRHTPVAAVAALDRTPHRRRKGAS